MNRMHTFSHSETSSSETWVFLEIYPDHVTAMFPGDPNRYTKTPRDEDQKHNLLTVFTFLSPKVPAGREYVGIAYETETADAEEKCRLVEAKVQELFAGQVELPQSDHDALRQMYHMPGAPVNGEQQGEDDGRATS